MYIRKYVADLYNDEKTQHGCKTHYKCLQRTITDNLSRLTSQSRGKKMLVEGSAGWQTWDLMRRNAFDSSV